MSESSTILVVEDNDFVRMQIAGFLKGASHNVVEARNGEEALEIMSPDNAVNLAIVDVRMSPMGGFEFLRLIRSQNIGTPVILVTGDQTADILEQAGKLGVSAVLMKPVEKDRLIKTVERTIESRRRVR
jgi:CheY-like chemotaxis protein